MPPSPAKKLSTESNFVKLEEGEPVYENNNDIIELILKRAQLSKVSLNFQFNFLKTEVASGKNRTGASHTRF